LLLHKAFRLRIMASACLQSFGLHISENAVAPPHFLELFLDIDQGARLRLLVVGGDEFPDAEFRYGHASTPASVATSGCMIRLRSTAEIEYLDLT
jgi:hypothetical protein